MWQMYMSYAIHEVTRQYVLYIHPVQTYTLVDMVIMLQAV